MLTSYAARPPSCQRVFERLGLAQPAKWVAADVPDEIVNGLQNLRIGVLPMEVVFPSALGPGEPHFSSAIARSVSLPASASSIEASRRAAFAGLRKRCSVSIRP